MRENKDAILTGLTVLMALVGITASLDLHEYWLTPVWVVVVLLAWQLMASTEWGRRLINETFGSVGVQLLPDEQKRVLSLGRRQALQDVSRRLDATLATNGRPLAYKQALRDVDQLLGQLMDEEMNQ